MSLGVFHTWLKHRTLKQTCVSCKAVPSSTTFPLGLNQAALAARKAKPNACGRMDASNDGS